jgi:probable HAF family extracellular repeat protein
MTLKSGLLYIVLSTFAFASASYGQSYSVIELNFPGGTYSSAAGINNKGDVVGTGYTSNGFEHAFLYSGGQMTDIGILAGDWSEADAINDNGQIVGSSQLYPSFIYSEGAITALPTFNGGAVSVTAINKTGEAVGYYDGPYGPAALVYSGGNWTNILNPLFSYYSYAYDINTGRQIVVNEVAPFNGFEGAYQYSGGVGTALGSLGGASHGSAINGIGQIVGWSETNRGGVHHAFTYNGVTMSDLGTLGGNSEAYALNNKGQIVGASAGHAFLSTNGVMVDLAALVPGSGWVLTEALGINDRGEIVGNGTNPSGQSRAFLLGPGCNLKKYTDGTRFTGAAIWADADFFPSLAAINQAAVQNNVYVYVTSSFRPAGYDPQDAVVTPAQRSNHLVGHAIDMNVQYYNSQGILTFCNSGCLATPPAPVAGFIQAVTNSGLGLRWGGTFTPRDVVHFDDNLNNNNPTLWKAKFASLQQCAFNAGFVLRTHSPVNVLITDPIGRRIGTDASGQPVNDFGQFGGDSGPGEPRTFAISQPLPGNYTIQTIGTGTGPFTIEMFNSVDVSTSLNNAEPLDEPLVIAGNTSPGFGNNFSLSLSPGADNGASLSPALAITRAAFNVVLSWPTNFTDFALQATTNLVSPAWTTNLPAPVVVSGHYTVTNAISGTQQFFRLAQ